MSPRILETFPISPPALVATATALVIFIFLVYTFVLLYHWSRYAEKRSVFALALSVYSAVSALILTLLMGSALTLTL